MKKLVAMAVVVVSVVIPTLSFSATDDALNKAYTAIEKGNTDSAQSHLDTADRYFSLAAEELQ